ncbi:MAG: transposase [Candidatus Schekmanbacteria bacterium]|nr:transposase [Candidatus Schekmanbacteria bacterium]
MTVNYEQALEQTVVLREVLPPDHLARFVVMVVAELDLSAIYERYGARGRPAYAPDILLGLLFYGYATGVFSSRKIERATYGTLPFRFIAGGLHPDHDKIAEFRKAFLGEIGELFVQILLYAQLLGVLRLGNISLDGTKIHADASKSKAVSHKRLLELEVQLRQEVAELLTLGKQADQGEAQLPDGLVRENEIALRQQRLVNLAEAKAVLEARAEERYAAELADYEAKLHDRVEKARKTGHKPGGLLPKPPQPGPRDKDQYNFTDSDSRVMKNSSNQGFEQHYNAQAAVEQESLLVVATTLSNHPSDQRELEPTLDAIPAALGTPEAAAVDNGYFSRDDITACEDRDIEPYIATGREAHHKNWRAYFATQPASPPEDTSPTVKMAYKLETEIGQAIYRLRKCTVEPVIGIIKEVLGFRQFSLRGLAKAAGEWCLVCLAWNLKRLHVLAMVN